MVVTPRVQISLGTNQYARLLKWMKKARWTGKPDAFARKKFLKLLDEAMPAKPSDNQPSEPSDEPSDVPSDSKE